MSGQHDLDGLAQEPIDDMDVRVLEQVARLFETLDPVPTSLVERINFGITLEGLHAEIAELQRSGDLAGVRSAGADAAQTVTFSSSSLTVMVTITPVSGDRARIDGWIAPGGGVNVEMRSPSGLTSVTADADGRFVFDDVARGLVRFLVRPPEGVAQQPVLTPSIEI